MRYFVAIVLSLFLTGAQAQNHEEYKWSEELKLNWTDFKGLPDQSSSFEALTTWGIKYSYGMDKDGNVTVDVGCYFSPSESWVKKGHKTDRLLSHEQLHFDIAEIYARKLRKTVSESYNNGKVTIEKVKGLYQQIMNECVNEHTKYDEETDHSLIEDKQLEWERKIQKDLRDLKKFK